jgi:hypothetical protein
MSPIAVSDFSDPATDSRVADLLDGLAADTLVVPDTSRRRRLRELLRPEANGDQDTW